MSPPWKRYRPPTDGFKPEEASTPEGHVRVWASHLTPYFSIDTDAWFESMFRKLAIGLDEPVHEARRRFALEYERQYASREFLEFRGPPIPQRRPKPAARPQPTLFDALPAAKPAPGCRAPADLVVYRGRYKRLYLCAAHGGRYTGKGKVMDHDGESMPCGAAFDMRRN